MKRIAIDLTSLDDNFSGLERYAFELTKELLEQSKEDKFILIFKNKIFPYFEKNKKQNVEFYICIGGKLKVNQFKIAKAIKIISPDVVYFPAFPPSLLIKKKKNIRYVCMIHDLVAWDQPKTMKWKSKWLFKLGIQHAVKISDAITTNSFFSKSRIEAVLKPKVQVNVIPCGVKDSIIKEDAAEKFSLPNRYCLSLGTLEPRKNFVELIQYYIRFCKENSEEALRLVIVGRKGWKMEEALKEIEGLDEFVQFTGFVEDEYLKAIYSKAECFLFASLYEGFGIPVIEAVKFGTIPIVSNIQSNKELLGESYEFLFEIHSYSSFKETFEKFLKMDDVKKKEVQKNCLDRIKNYTWEISAKELLKII